MKSMTGFGIRYVEGNLWKISCVIRGVNSKYLEVDIFLPHRFLHLEPQLRKKIGKHVKRGKVDVKITVSKPKIFSLLDGFFGPSENDVMKAFENALESFLESREEEGKELENEIKSRVNNIKKAISQIEKLHKNFPKLIRKMLIQRVNEITQKLNITVDEKTIDTAGVVHIIRKADIWEEISRIKSHLKAFEKEMKNEGDGKKLLFLSQEILRELNTMGTKAIDTKIIHLTILAKLEIERIREQLHNIE